MTRPTLLKIICGLALAYLIMQVHANDAEFLAAERTAFELEILKAEQKQFEDFRFGRSREVNELAESEYE